MSYSTRALTCHGDLGAGLGVAEEAGANALLGGVLHTRLGIHIPRPPHTQGRLHAGASKLVTI